MDIKANSLITFDTTFVSPIALRTMASEATKQRDTMDGVSAAHYTAWGNLAAALDARANAIEQQEGSVASFAPKWAR